MDERQERARRNETLFRTVNDQLEDLDETFGTATEDAFDLVCECGDGDCVEKIAVPSAEYVRVRRDATLYILIPGHEDPGVEVVVEQGASYLVVRKPPNDLLDGSSG